MGVSDWVDRSWIDSLWRSRHTFPSLILGLGEARRYLQNMKAKSKFSKYNINDKKYIERLYTGAAWEWKKRITPKVNLPKPDLWS